MQSLSSPPLVPRAVMALVLIVSAATTACSPCSRLEPDDCSKRSDCTLERTHLADKEGGYETVKCISKK